MREPKDRQLRDQRALRPGDWVQVRAADEIAATLDEHGQLDGIPFMPEMLAAVGQRYQVLRRAEAACASQEVMAIRRLQGVVHLEDSRCDGSHHGHCQSDCLFFWKEEWLQATAPPQDARQPIASQQVAEVDQLLPIVTKFTQEKDQTRYRCQATQLWQASRPLPAWDLRQYLRQVLLNRAGLLHVVSSVLKSVGRKLRQRFARIATSVSAGGRTPVRDLSLQVGELVEVLPHAQILATLDPAGKNRGLWFDPQMAQYCNRQFRVAAKIERIIDEGTGRLIEFRTPTVRLESIACDGCWHRFCSREAPLFWREIWLQRVEPIKNAQAQPDAGKANLYNKVNQEQVPAAAIPLAKEPNV